MENQIYSSVKETALYVEFSKKISEFEDLSEQEIFQMPLQEYKRKKENSDGLKKLLNDFENSIYVPTTPCYGYSKEKDSEYLRIVGVSLYDIGPGSFLPGYILRNKKGFFSYEPDPVYKGLHEEHNKKDEVFEKSDRDLIFSSDILILPNGNLIESLSINDFIDYRNKDTYMLKVGLLELAKTQQEIILNYQKLDSELAPKATTTKKLKI